MKNESLLKLLESGELRVAEKKEDTWTVNRSVKEDILNLFKTSKTVEFPNGFRDKDALRTQSFEAKSNIRMVPGGSSVRAGAHIGNNVVIMPPSYINIGAFVDSSTMIDSHVLVGSCAQIGKKVHLSAGVQIGGVLEPIGNTPVIIEDECFIGAGSIIVEGIIIKKRAVIAPGLILSASVPIYDTVNERIIKGYIPENAVVIQGSKKIKKNPWSEDNEISSGCAIIIKYRDSRTDASLELETILRQI